MVDIDNYEIAIAELSLSGEVSLGQCSKSTVYRWARIINEHLAYEKCDWRVKPDVKTRSLKVCPA